MRRLHFIAFGVLFSLMLVARGFGGDAVEQPTPADLEFFEQRIRPVLVEHCYKCHSEAAEEIKGALRVDSRSSIRRGGQSGRAIVPRSLKQSRLIAAIRYQDEDLRMPPSGKLPDQVIADFVKWVEMGAPDPRLNSPRKLRAPSTSQKTGSAPATREPSTDIEARRHFWSFQPLRKASPPAVQGPSWPRSEIDHFVLATLEKNSLQPGDDADKYTLLRRLCIDLIGLPPTPEQIAAFVHDDSSDAYEKVVDRLLVSRHFGERWGRHWLDLAQYADTFGLGRIFPTHGAWRYRDYVIRALNQDKPLDRFVSEQIAGDLLPYQDDDQHAEQIVATQFLTQGPLNVPNQFKEQLRMDIVDNQVDKVGRVLLGLTLGCARCHDHKFDPVPQADYYALAGILQNVQVLDGFHGRSGVFSDWLHLPIPESAHEYAERQQRLARREQKVRKLESSIAVKKTELAQLEDQAIEDQKSALAAETQQEPSSGEASSEDEPPEEAKSSDKGSSELQQVIDKLKKETTQLEKELTDFASFAKANPLGPPTVLAASEPDRSTNARINIRGNAMALGAEIPRGFLRVVPGNATPQLSDNTSGRLELAQWLTGPDNPLVARVFVNRVWHHLFGAGIVRTVDNFGQRGQVIRNCSIIWQPALSKTVGRSKD